MAQWHVYTGTCRSLLHTSLTGSQKGFPCCLRWGEAGVSVCMHAQGMQT